MQQENWGKLYGEYSENILSEIYDQNLLETISKNKMHQYNVKITRIENGSVKKKTIYVVADPQNFLKLKPDTVHKKTTINLTTRDKIHQQWQTVSSENHEKMTLDIGDGEDFLSLNFMHLDPNNLYCNKKELKNCGPILLDYIQGVMIPGWNIKIFRDRSFEFRAQYYPGMSGLKVGRGNLEIENKKLVFRVFENLGVSDLEWP